ncbi:hypothetical protein HEK616_24480 [Streptomyces nigrescens]|uniref:Secreted protein n=1 Tax=Streptomyces nigrescens TaxID=1920 RepID=A0ABN6QVL8_STRNI|nr:hypothetical protein HEK616_24480 [Streptomyces nigrescens]
MTVFRVRPWFLPASLTAFLSEVWPDGPADPPSDAGPGDRADAASDTRSGECRPGDPPTGTGSRGEHPENPADRP